MSVVRTVSPEDLARLKREREEADLRYNQALTVVDRALFHAPAVPPPPAAPDTHQLTALNERWQILPDGTPALGSGLRGRLAGFIWRLVGPYLQQQQAFNSALVDHLNRNMAVAEDTHRAIAQALAVLGESLDAVSRFHRHLIVYFQQITPFVDTKDYEFAGLARRLHEDVLVQLERLDEIDRRLVGLNAAIGGVGDEMLKRWESLAVEGQRHQSAVAAMAAAHGDIRQTLGTLTQSLHVVRREVEALATRAAAGTLQSPAATVEGTPAIAGTGPAPTAAGVRGAMTSALDAGRYVGFEDRYRGSEDDITAGLAAYVPLFAGAEDVLDIGCGRGEFIALLAQHGIRARGVDLNPAMVDVCRARGLDVQEADALAYLNELPDGSLGGLFAAQVVEHLEPDYLLRLLDAAYAKLRPGSTIVLETINVACWFAFFSSYIRDVTHIRPLHPDTLRYFVATSGFQDVEIRFKSPYPDHQKLQPVPGTDLAHEILNANAEKLNALLFTSLEYAAVGRR